MGVEAAVGAHGELPAGPAVAHPAHLSQEVGGAASGVGAALPGVRRRYGQQRVIAPLAGVAVVAGAFLGQTVCLADGGVQVNGQGRVARSGPSRPGPGQHSRPGPLADMSPSETAQEGPQGGWRLDRPPRVRAVPPVRRRRSMQSPPASRATS